MHTYNQLAALGVGSKTLVPPAPLELLMEGHSPDELEVLNCAETPADVDSTAMETADAAMIRSSQVSPTSTRSSAAMQSLMEQGTYHVGLVYHSLTSKHTPIGGRVELVVSKRDKNSPVLTRTIGDLSTGTQVSPVASSSSQVSPMKRPPLEEESSSDTARIPPVERPTYVQLPSPQSFTPDEASASTSSPSAVLPQSPFTLSHSRTSSMSPTIFDLEVLVVDDDPVTRMLMKRLLSRLGCSVSTAENGDIALEMILGAGGNYSPSIGNSTGTGPILEQSTTTKSDDNKYHIIFLDNQMPVLSGLKTIEKLREAGRGDFVVGVTGEYCIEVFRRSSTLTMSFFR